jgi:hypothetical protein
MESFPELNKNQVTLIRADKITGHVLDEQLILAADKNQKVYTVFESLNEAKIFVESFLSTNHNIELVIYSSKKDVLFYSNE